MQSPQAEATLREWSKHQLRPWVLPSCKNALMERAMLQLQEAANEIIDDEQKEKLLSRQGDDSNAAVPASGGVNDYSSSTAQEQRGDLLQQMTKKEPRALADSPKYADRVLKVGESYFHALKDLVVKRSTLLSNVFENDLDQTDKVVPLHMPDTDAYAFRLMLESLYTGDIPDDTRMAQYAIPLAQNPHYLDTDELYKACIAYLRANWRKVQQLDVEAFKKDSALPLVEETLKLMRPDAIEDKLFFLAAVWHAECDEQAWRHIVEPQISTPQFSRGLSHKQLLRLQDCSQVPDNSPDNNVAVERDAAADKTKKLICTRCRMPMTLWLVDNDPAGCTALPPTNTMGFSLGGNLVNHQPKHTVPAEQRSAQTFSFGSQPVGSQA
eukprot:5052-Heterococcus_DN1.PRE.1